MNRSEYLAGVQSHVKLRDTVGGAFRDFGRNAAFSSSIPCRAL
jgi:hypothetical protein